MATSFQERLINSLSLSLSLCKMPNAAEGEFCLLVTLYNPTLTQEHFEERIQEITATLTAPC